MNTDVRISTGYPDHPKIRRLRKRLGGEGVMCHLFLLCFTARMFPEGVLRDMDAEDIAEAASWRGEAEEFVSVLHELKLLDKYCETFSIHDWQDHNLYAMCAPIRREIAKKAAAARWKNKRHRHDSAKGNAPSNAPSPSPSPVPSPERKVSLSPPYEKIKDAWNASATHLPPIKVIGHKRRQTIEELWSEFPDLDTWKLVFQKANRSKYLTDNQTFIRKNSYEGWKADFDYITRGDIFIKLYEGSFDGT